MVNKSAFHFYHFNSLTENDSIEIEANENKIFIKKNNLKNELMMLIKASLHQSHNVVLVNNLEHFEEHMPKIQNKRTYIWPNNWIYLSPRAKYFFKETLPVVSSYLEIENIVKTWN